MPCDVRHFSQSGLLSSLTGSEMSAAGHLLLLLLSLAGNVSSKHSGTTSAPGTMEDNYSDIQKELEMLRQTVANLSKQVMMQQFFVEERVRTEGNSGVKVVRGGKRGLKNYGSASHLSPAAFAIHDHSNYDRTVGLGEMSVVMNGVEFRTRHNDYKLVMPSTQSGEFHAVEDIPFPDVPPEVTNKSTVEEQIAEMREWYKAFHKQDTSIRDYTKYFKPVLCYMEGAWTLDKELEEPFPSDRHTLDATSWSELHQRNRFNAFSGAKNRWENIAFLPTTIVSVNMTSGESQFAQWNYRILCNPVNFDIPLSNFHQEDDMTFRVSTGLTISETSATRAARFKLFDTARPNNHQLLDELFSTIPGKNNHGGNLSFSVYGEDMLDTAFTDKEVPLNTAYYHRSYKSVKPGAGGTSYAAFGFNDDNMWMAQTTQQRVAPFEADECTFVQIRVGRIARQCRETHLRVSYAIPLEVIFMTPLLSWNPYNLTFHNDVKLSWRDGRTGGKDKMALDGIDKFRYYKTPVEFFSGPLDRSDPADTVRGYMHVQDPDDKVRRVSASGTRVVLQEIQGVGKIRLRYPIAPVHGEGSSVWKELTALKDKVLGSSGGVPSSVAFQMSLAVLDPPGEHTHEFTVTYHDFSLLVAGQTINVTTEEAQGHTHDLTIFYMASRKAFRYTLCDGVSICTDGHLPLVTLMTKNAYTELP